VRPTTTRLLLVRHGESTWNAEGRWQGQADPPLSADGERQARLASPVIARLDPGAVWSSDLSRAAATARILAGPARPVRDVPGLRERDVGEWVGCTRAQLDARHPGWSSDGWRPPGWESDHRLAARAQTTLDAIVATERPGATMLVVTHGGIIRVLVGHLGATPGPVPNLAGVWLHHRRGAFSVGAPVDLLDRAALGGPTRPAPVD